MMTASLTDFEKQLLYTAFYRHLNLAPREIERRLGLPEETAPSAVPADPTAASAPDPSSQPDPPPVADAAPDPPGLTEDQRIGLRLVRIKRKKKEELTDEDYVLMREAVNYIRRHGDHPPKAEDKLDAWRAGLLTWGYDPNKARPSGNPPPASHA